jgi:hypothetical protein
VGSGKLNIGKQGKTTVKLHNTQLVCRWTNHFHPKKKRGWRKKYRSMSTVRRSEKAWDASLDIFSRAMSK